LTVAFSQIAVFADCNTCQALKKAGYNINSQHSVYLDTDTLSAAGLTAAQNAIDKWNEAYSNEGKTPPFTYSSNPSTAGIVVHDDPSLHGGSSGGEAGGGFININPDYDGAGDFLKLVMLHEFGHVIGFQDTWTSGCDGQTVMYGGISPNASSYLTSLTSTDVCDLDREWDRMNHEIIRPPGGYGAAEGNGSDSPIVINLANGGYRLTGADAPVLFDISDNGSLTRIGWTSAGADEAFLCLDRDHNGKITSGAELFGDATPMSDGQRAANGFIALAEFDDDHNSVIDERDAIWSHLLLWRDLNHDGISQASELALVTGSAVKAISVDYHWTGRRDSSGNTFRYESKVWITKNGHATPSPVYDIFFAEVP
jgi:hypothetical protein